MEYHLTLDQKVIDKYAEYYFSQHPRAWVKPIQHPYHESINKWFIMNREQMNTLKQKWNSFCVWWLGQLGLCNIKLEKFEMTFITYMPSRRRTDPDNTVPKFILDAFTEVGFIVDDDGTHLLALTLKTGYDKDNPRTEIYVKVVE